MGGKIYKKKESETDFSLSFKESYFSPINSMRGFFGVKKDY